MQSNHQKTLQHFLSGYAMKANQDILGIAWNDTDTILKKVEEGIVQGFVDLP